MYVPFFLIVAIFYWIFDDKDEYPEGYIESYYHNLDTKDLY